MDHRAEAHVMLLEREKDAAREEKRQERRALAQLTAKVDVIRSLCDLRDTEGGATVAARCRKSIAAARASMDQANDIMFIRQRQGEIAAYKAVMAHVESAPAKLKGLEQEVRTLDPNKQP